MGAGGDACPLTMVGSVSKDYAAKIDAYGKKKADMPLYVLIIQGFMAGFWLGLAAHVATVTAGAFKTDHPFSGGMTRIIYGSTFPVGFMAVVWTHSELYTGNTAAMSLYLWRRRDVDATLALLRNWVVSLFMNLIGCATIAFFISWLPGNFSEETGGIRGQLFGYALHKTTQGWGGVMLNGIGCNLLVCFATFCAVTTSDGAGKYLTIWLAIGTFCMASFEHVVANFYTLAAALMYNAPGVTWEGVIAFNWIPVWLGNTIAGVLLGTVWYWTEVHHLPPLERAHHHHQAVSVKQTKTTESGSRSSMSPSPDDIELGPVV